MGESTLAGEISLVGFLQQHGEKIIEKWIERGRSFIVTGIENFCDILRLIFEKISHFFFLNSACLSRSTLSS
jgi:hypothetical protein